MLKTKCFIIGMISSLSLQAKGVVYCPPAPVGAIVKKRLEREQKEKEFNRPITVKRGGFLGDYAGETKKERLLEALLFAGCLCFIGISPLLFVEFLKYSFPKKDKDDKEN